MSEVCREVLAVYRGTNAAIATALRVEDKDADLLGRHYLFWKGGKPITVIQEVFSPKLVTHLGPVSG